MTAEAADTVWIDGHEYVRMPMPIGLVGMDDSCARKLLRDEQVGICADCNEPIGTLGVLLTVDDLCVLVCDSCAEPDSARRLPSSGWPGVGSGDTY